MQHQAQPPPHLSHADPWGNPFICCDNDHAASSSSSSSGTSSTPIMMSLSNQGSNSAPSSTLASPVIHPNPQGHPAPVVHQLPDSIPGPTGMEMFCCEDDDHMECCADPLCDKVPDDVCGEPRPPSTADMGCCDESNCDLDQVICNQINAICHHHPCPDETSNRPSTSTSGDQIVEGELDAEGIKELERWACSKEGCHAIQQYLDCCNQGTCSDPVISSGGGHNSHAQMTHHHHDHSHVPHVHHHDPFPLDMGQMNHHNTPFSSAAPTPVLPSFPEPTSKPLSNWQTSTVFTPNSTSTVPSPSTTAYATPNTTILATHVCHWQNCHRMYPSMPDLLSHVATDHLGAAGFPQAESQPAVPMPRTSVIDTSGPTLAELNASLQATLSSPNNNADVGSSGMNVATMFNQMNGMTGSVENSPLVASNSSTGQRSMASDVNNGHGLLGMTTQQQQQAATDAANQALLSCLWDDCFPMPECTAPVPQDCPTHSNMPAHPNLPSHAHTHNSITGEPFSPQTMLRHVLEEHLGVPGSIIGWDAVAPSAQGDDTLTNAGQNIFEQLLLSSQTQENIQVAHQRLHQAELASQMSQPARIGNHQRSSSLVHRHRHSHAHTHPTGECHASHSHSHNRSQSLSHVHSHGRKSSLNHVTKPSLAHTPSPPADRVSKCLWPGCKESHLEFQTSGDLMDHLNEHIGKGKDCYTCEWDGCGRLFRSRQKVLRHLQSHIGHKPFICPECDQGFGEAAPLAAHMRRHAQEKPFKCEHPGCGKTFAISSSLTIHMRTHNGEKPFICPHCSKGFVEASNLTKHIRTHTGERPFACSFPGCDKRFPRPDQLKRHMGVHDNDKRRRGSKSKA